MRHFILSLYLLFLAVNVLAQGLRMAILDMPASVHSLSMGGCSLGAMTGAYVYTNPSAAFGAEISPVVVDYDVTLVAEEQADNMYLHSLSASYRTGNHLLMGGVRYYAQGTIDRLVDENMQMVPWSHRLYSYRVDLGYARQFQRAVVYGTLGIASEQTVSQTDAYRISLGGSFRGEVGSMPYTLGVEVRDLGLVSHLNKNHALSPLVHCGGTLSCPIGFQQTLGLYVDGGSYLPVDGADVASMVCGGLSYSIAGRYSLSAGAHCGDRNNFATSGLSVRIGWLTILGSCRFGWEDGQSSMYMIGARFSSGK